MYLSLSLYQSQFCQSFVYCFNQNFWYTFITHSDNMTRLSKLWLDKKRFNTLNLTFFNKFPRETMQLHQAYCLEYLAPWTLSKCPSIDSIEGFCQIKQITCTILFFFFLTFSATCWWKKIMSITLRPDQNHIGILSKFYQQILNDSITDKAC